MSKLLSMSSEEKERILEMHSPSRVIEEQMNVGTIQKDYMLAVDGGGMSKIIPIIVKKGSPLRINTGAKFGYGNRIEVMGFEGPLSSKPEVGGKLPSPNQFIQNIEVSYQCSTNKLFAVPTKNNLLDRVENVLITPSSSELINELKQFCKK